MNAQLAQILSTVVVVVFALMVIAVRLKASNRPTSVRKIVIPPLGMSTGFLMFVVPQTHIPWNYAGLALLAGLLFSYPLIRTSKMEVRGGEIYVRRSKGFIVVIFALLALRIILHDQVEKFVTIPQTGALFYLLAFAMILPWRIAMLLEYRKTERRLSTASQGV